jgi:peptidoglycan hydrolase CwlO-like protein
MNKASEAIKLVKQRDRTITKLEKDLEKAKGELEKLRERIAVMEAA